MEQILNVEIFDQEHQMFAEGISAEKTMPTQEDIEKYLLNEKGWIASDVEIEFDSMMGFWRWSCDIKKL